MTLVLLSSKLLLLNCFQDQRRKVDFVLVFEEDKKDADIEIPKVN